MAAGDINDPLSNVPNIVLVDQSAATAAPGAGYGRVELVNGVLGVRLDTGAWVALVSLVAGILTSLTEKVTPASTDLLLLQDEADSSNLKKVQITNLPGGGDGGGLYDALAILEDQKATSSSGGTFTQGDWRTRTLNTEVVDASSIVTLAANQFTLAAGTYHITGTAPALQVAGHQCRLYDTTGAASLAAGSCGYSGAAAVYGQTHSIVDTVVTLGVESTLELQHRCEATRADIGFGTANGNGTEVFARVVIRRLAA